MLAEGECAADPGLHGQQPELGESDGLRGEARNQLGDIRVRAAPPERLRAGQQLVRSLRVVLGAIDALVAQPAELDGVDARRTRSSQVDEVPGRPAEQDLRGPRRAIGLDDPPQVGHVRLDRRGHLLGWITGHSSSIS